MLLKRIKKWPVGVTIDDAMNYEAWQVLLPLDDPERDFRLNGIKHGFCVTTTDYDGLPVWHANYQSASAPDIASLVEAQICEEIDNARYIIIQEKTTHNFGIGCYFKRLNHDCIHLQAGNALNDLATCDKFSYWSVQDAVSLITPGC